MKTLFLLIITLIFCQIVHSQAVSCTPSSLASDWICIGPKSNIQGENNMGRITAVWVDQDNPDYILVGTRASGVWKSIDGGENWSNLTGFQLPAVGISEIVVFKDAGEESNNKIYCSTLFNGSDLSLYNAGLIYSEDNGENWTKETTFPFSYVSWGLNDVFGSNFIAFKPGTSALWISNYQNIFIRNVSPIAWGSILEPFEDVPLDVDVSIKEIDFKPGDANYAIVSPSNGTVDHLVYTSDGGVNWNSLPTPTPTVPVGGSYEMFCSTSIPNDDYAYVLFKFYVQEADGSESTEVTLGRYEISGTPSLYEYTSVAIRRIQVSNATL